MPIVTGLLFSFAGRVAVVASLQVVYERLFDQEHRGWRDLPRYVVWAVVVLGLWSRRASSTTPSGGQRGRWSRYS
ncbi:MAG TPA: hypothetical protein VMU39_12840 [Solirubrobacteraceae bacterium]|nr:hypothetical protein [Solirubrobacteraceae bacterium]